MNPRLVTSATAAAVVLAGVLCFALTRSTNTGGAANVPAAESVSPRVDRPAALPLPVSSAPTDPSAASAKPEAKNPAVFGTPNAPTATIIEPGTPVRFMNSYLPPYVPAEIKKDGTQVFKNIPYQALQPDGTFKTEMMTMTINPTGAVQTDADVDQNTQPANANASAPHSGGS